MRPPPQTLGSGGTNLAEQMDKKQVSDLFAAWDMRMWQQARGFEALTTEALKVDTELTSFASRARELRNEQTELGAKQKVGDDAVARIWEQQDALGALLAGLESSLELGQANKADADRWPARAAQRAVGLEPQLEEVARQVDP